MISSSRSRPISPFALSTALSRTYPGRDPRACVQAHWQSDWVSRLGSPLDCRGLVPNVRWQ
jgi:hypothetical protein